MSPAINTRILGKSGVAVTELGFGGAGLGELFVRVDEATAAATLKAAWTPASATSIPPPTMAGG